MISPCIYIIYEFLSPGELALFCNALASEPAHCATVAPDLLHRAVELRQAPEPLTETAAYGICGYLMIFVADCCSLLSEIDELFASVCMDFP